MRSVSIIFLTVLPLTLSAIDSETVKRTIALQKQRLEIVISSQEKSQILYELAVAYYQDQEQDLAFKTFLEALDLAEKRSPAPISEEEKKYYLPALEEYLSYTGYDPTESGNSLLKKYELVAQNHPDFCHLNFLLATAYANIGQYEQFFDRFYRSYPTLSDSFIAHKTQGILYLRLAHRTQVGEERSYFQKAAIEQLNLALAQNPQDMGLYRILILFAKEEKKRESALSYLKGIVDQRAPIPRADIQFYVHEAVEQGEFALAQQIVDLARELYDFSRAVSAAQDYLNQNRSQQSTRTQ